MEPSFRSDLLESPWSKGGLHTSQRLTALEKATGSNLRIGVWPTDQESEAWNRPSAVEQRELDLVVRTRRPVVASPGEERLPDVPHAGQCDLKWQAGAEQMQTVLREVRTVLQESADDRARSLQPRVVV